jgi:hypothetical protein
VNLNLRWHDLRATTGTWLAVEGRATEIRDVLGHTQVSMTDRYMRDATAVRGGQFGEPFPPLPPIRHGGVKASFAVATYAASPAIWRGGRDSKTAKSPDSRHFAQDPRNEDRARVDASAQDPVPVGPSRDGSAPAPPNADETLAFALARAAEAARWDVVAQLARELEARRLKGPGRQPR